LLSPASKSLAEKQPAPVKLMAEPGNRSKHLPAVISSQVSWNEPRYPAMKGIMQAKKKPVASG
jgi:hypothetical protein